MCPAQLNLFSQYQFPLLTNVSGDDFEDAENEIKCWKEIIGISAADELVAQQQSNEILDDEDTDDESEESGNKEDAERSILSTADNDENAYDLGSPKKSGSL
ncbi:hypothetical protein G6F42_016899 [Rhizopus arrhizus]|nr:hypothetical protein G6F42_016899 [Rhizopus arrhizus]